jgi:hypothetical protein
MSLHDSRRAPCGAQSRFLRVLTLGLAAGAPAAVLAEGAVKVLDCTIARVCDGAGRCNAGTGKVEFRMEPKSLGAGSAGRYSLQYDGESADMEALSDAGPFVWSLAGERHALLASSETEWLWHALLLEPAPKAVVRFLACSFEG